MSSKKKRSLFPGFGGKKVQQKPPLAVGGVEFTTSRDGGAEGAANEPADVVRVDSAAPEAASAGAPSDAPSAEPAMPTGDASVKPEDLSAPVQGRSGRWLNRGKVAANVHGDTKQRAAKPAKIKTPKTKKVKAVEEELSLPVNVAVDFYRGVTKERDAEQIARAFVEKNFDAPNASYLYVQKWRDGCAVEMQEGGGKAYLPEVLAKLDEDDDALVALPMSGRVLQVRLDPDTKTLEALVLTAGQQPVEDAFIALPTKKMSPIDKRGSKVFIAGMGLLAASLIALIFSVGAFFIDTNAWSLPYLQQTRVKDLPSAQTKTMQRVLESADCVAKMEYDRGQWNIIPGWDNGSGQCSSSAVPVAPALVAEPQDPALLPEAVAPVPAPGGPPAVGSAPTPVAPQL